jgi:YbgC/YbaW family acyl-CoA thioester hydrolase
VTRNEFRFFEPLRVRWAEVDMHRIVFNGHYLMYFDTAVGAYWRALALPYEQTMLGLGGDLFVRKATVEYEAPARYDDLLAVGIRCARIGNSSLLLNAAVYRGEDRLVQGELVYVFADPDSRAVKPVPPALREVLRAFEAGEAMVQVRLGRWDQLGRDAQAIRSAVFVQEQKIPAELEWDASDTGCMHAVAYNRFGLALGTGRLLEHVPGVAKIGRMAVTQSVRGGGVGRAVLDALTTAARQRGDREALLHAQISAAPFYRRAGFTQRGEPFDEAGIAHVEMVCAL